MCLQDEVLVLRGKRMSSEQSEVRMQFAGRSPCFTNKKRMSSERSEF